MNTENKVAVITDSGASLRPENPEVEKLGVTIVPLEISFYENGEYVARPDLDVSSEEFYERMKSSQKLPKTSGAVVGTLFNNLEKVSEQTRSAISIHVTSKHSVAYESALLAKSIFNEDGNEKMLIEVVDSKNVSLATWFLAEQAAELAQKGANLERIKNEVLESVPKIQLYTVLQSFENLIKGGRAGDVVKGVLASILSIYPVICFSDGTLTQFDRDRTPKKARERMIQMVGDESKLVKVAVIHTNAPELAEGVRDSLTAKFSDPISIYEAGPVLAVHAGQGAVGIAFQRA